jgi:hypothetical protein
MLFDELGYWFKSSLAEYTGGNCSYYFATFS